MVLPENYVTIEEEMTYLDGGGQTYSGYSGWREVSSMLASLTRSTISAGKSAVAAGALASTGVGGVGAILILAGAKVSFISAAINVGAAAASITFMARYNKFQSKSWSIFGFGAHLVRRV
ncbi:hypothetical protein HMI01_28230 [Halolactibacillus miurensis]|uniref:Uncharacterized protein n=1 Tax=Halolactibacillus miurensis TaxID=306541 RepID=A0A1I6V1H6_9BACI|nr:MULTISPECIES: hypothetical protein [Halolactibacillus]GEM05835.1 hypothetical protein HMI01_28230 [Halolactibacillus miurensis]SFT07559.1 hypothetical protein SAMN05421668_14012 [Halolactibacillus miurensis]